jgi:hypothetical protein
MVFAACAFLVAAINPAYSACGHTDASGVRNPSPEQGPLLTCVGEPNWTCPWTFYRDVYAHPICGTPAGSPNHDCVTDGYALMYEADYDCGPQQGGCTLNESFNSTSSFEKFKTQACQ